MDDVAALRRTIRRCTAVLVVVLGVIAAYSAPYGPDTSIGYPLAYAAVGYLGVSLLAGLFRRAVEAGPDGHAGEIGGGDGSGGSGGTGGDDGEETADSDSGDTAGDDETDHPPVSTFGGGQW
jgi:hypothetical protein